MVKLRKILSLCILICLVLLRPSISLAAIGEVNDQAGILDEATKANLQDKISSIEADYRVPVFIYTTNEDLNISVRNRADTLLYDYVGKDNSGLLLYINMQTRDYYFTLSGNVLKMIDDKRQESLDKQLVSYLKDSDFNGAVKAFLDEASTYIEGGEISGNVLRDENSLTPMDYGIAGLGGLGSFLFSFFGLKSSNSPAPSKLIYSLMDNSNFAYTNSSDRFITSFTTSKHIPRTSSSGAGSSTTTTHKGPGGGNFSGRGGKF